MRTQCERVAALAICREESSMDNVALYLQLLTDQTMNGNDCRAINAFSHIDCPQDFEVIEFNFGNLVLSLRAIDDDMLGIEDSPFRGGEDYLFHELSASGIWRDLCSSSLRWVWQLVNQQGYNDAIQFEFVRKSASNAIIIQFVVVASSIKCFMVREM